MHASEAFRSATSVPSFSSADQAKPSSKYSEAEIPWDELHFIGAFQRCYLFFEHQDRLLAVDQHAFHERVLYERLLKDPTQLSRSQPLLMPDVLEFSPEECERLQGFQSILGRQGFDYSVISDTEVELRSVPSLLMKRDLQSVFQSILNGTSSQQEMLHDVLATIACHSAVRAGEDLPPAELKQLLDEAKTVDFFHNCPHGRRVFRWWKGNQVAAWFDRLG
jgi:DNA mismatch repair protein MutL